MKKIFLFAILLSSISLSSNASVMSNATGSIKKASSTKAVKAKPLEWYCQVVEFSCGTSAVCGETFNEYKQCLLEAKGLFECNG